MSPAPDNAAHEGAPQAPPGEADVRTELERILRSRCFEQAGRSSEFLKFVVEQALAGNSERIKGYTIAIEVFQRPPDFDAQSDPLVRVEAGRLRRRLMEYYVAEGHANPVRIDLPRGGYAPEFRFTQVADSPAEPTPLPARPKLASRWRRIRTVAVLAAIAALAAAVIMQANRPARRAATQTQVEMPAGPRVLVLPFENLTDDRALDYFAQGVTEEIMLRLSDLRVGVIASRESRYDRADGTPLVAADDAPAAGYVLTGSVRHTSDRIRIAARLVHVASGAQLWTEAYEENLSVPNLVAIQEKIAREVADTIAVPYGPIFQQELARTERKRPEQLETYDCVLKYYAYRRTANAVAHGDTLQCFEHAVEREPKFADAWAGLSLLYLDEYAFGYNHQPAAMSSLDRAREAARTALDIDGDSLLGNLALARVRFFSGDFEGFERSTARLTTLGPNDAEALALLGALWAIAGDPARARSLLDAAARSPQPPPASFVGRTIIDLRDGRSADALEWALKIDAPNWFIAPLLVAASAGLSGRSDIAQRAVSRLLELYPAFPEHARAELGKWQPDEKLLTALLRGLRAAGLDIA